MEDSVKVALGEEEKKTTTTK